LPPSIENLLHIECKIFLTPILSNGHRCLSVLRLKGGSEESGTSSLVILDMWSTFKHYLDTHCVRNIAKPTCKHPKSPGEILFLFKTSLRLWAFIFPV